MSALVLRAATTQRVMTISVSGCVIVCKLATTVQGNVWLSRENSAKMQLLCAPPKRTTVTPFMHYAHILAQAFIVAPVIVDGMAMEACALTPTSAPATRAAMGQHVRNLHVLPVPFPMELCATLQLSDFLK
jgi:hypothetical protein